VLYTALMTETRPALIWFRQDLRLADNPALQAAIASGAPVLPVYIHDDEAADSPTRAGV
jgi:deoxyribodipyrimidine photo-lyase